MLCDEKNWIWLDASRKALAGESGMSYSSHLLVLQSKTVTGGPVGCTSLLGKVNAPAVPACDRQAASRAASSSRHCPGYFSLAEPLLVTPSPWHARHGVSPGPSLPA